MQFIDIFKKHINKVGVTINDVMGGFTFDPALNS